MPATIPESSVAPLEPTVVPAGHGAVFHAFGDTIQMKLGAAQTGGRMAVGLGLVQAGGGPPPHRHRAEDEMFIVVDGTMSYLINGTWQDVGPGGVAFMPRGVPHTFCNRSDRPASHWIITTPSGFETFFSRCADVFAAAGSGPPDMARVMQICGEHGIEFLEPGGE